MEIIRGKRILIVEDDSLIGEVIAETISEAGGWPLGPVASEREALDMIDYNPGKPDAAILDIRFGGNSFDVATHLQGLGVPFIFASGHRDDVPVHLRSIQVCEKPYTIRELLCSLEQALATSNVSIA
jgi:DNA-binding response OmpR family regulator